MSFKKIDLTDQIKGKRIIITGGMGMLGNAFSLKLAELLPDCEFKVLSRKELDVRDKEAVLGWANWLGNGWIIHCAATVNVEECALNPFEAERTIVDGTRNIIELSKVTGSRILYPQSFLIYDEIAGFISEKEDPRPISLYGKLKYEAEKLIIAQSEKALIIRMAGFFGGNHRDKNFVGKIIQHLKKLIENGQSSICVGDRIWQPTWTNDLAMNSILLMANEEEGIYQMACQGTASFFNLTEEIVKILNWENLIKVIPVSESEISGNELGKRPSKAEFDCQKLKEKGLYFQRPWQSALNEYLQDPYFMLYRNLEDSIQEEKIHELSIAR